MSLQLIVLISTYFRAYPGYQVSEQSVTNERDHIVIQMRVIEWWELDWPVSDTAWMYSLKWGVYQLINQSSECQAEWLLVPVLQFIFVSVIAYMLEVVLFYLHASALYYFKVHLVSTLKCTLLSAPKCTLLSASQSPILSVPTKL